MAILPDRIIRSKRKSVSVGVDSLGRVTVRAPLRYPEDKITAFLAEKEEWILKHQKRMRATGIYLPENGLDGYGLLLLGERYILTLDDGKRVRLNEAEKRIFLPRENAEQRLKRWLKENAKRIFTQATRMRADEMGVSYQSVTISSATTRWGSCTGDNRLRFSYRLLYAPKPVIDYVIVHELCHTLHHDHSPRFWAAVESVIPDYKDKRKWLKDRGALLKIL